MIKLYRLVRAGRGDDAFSGEGAKFHGGRWNPPGFPAVYASQSRALAVLEMLVHLTLEARDMAFLIYEITLPKVVRLQRYKGAARAWRHWKSPVTSQDAGRAWLAQGTALALVVPSVIIPEEANYVLSVRHPQFEELRISKPQPFSFDERLWK
jgi:RES domain-containing protein